MKKLLASAVTIGTLVPFISGCSTLESAGLVSKPVTYEAISSQEEALQEIQASPTNFEVTIEENEAAWERARFFLQQYAGKGKIQSERAADRDVMTKAGSAGFRYQVARRFNGGKVNFQVFCTPKDPKRSTAQALLNAKNVARFVRSGELEVSQLIGG